MSDLIIKGMKMPKRCQACEFYYNDFSDGETSCLATGCEVSIGDHCDKGCPLVEIPTPHGDLIDRNEVISRALNLGTSHDPIVSAVIEATIKVLLLAVKDIPTVIGAEGEEAKHERSVN